MSAALLVALPAVAIVLIVREVRAYRRQQANRARLRAAGVLIDFAPAAARGRTRRPVPPAVSPMRRSRG